MVKTLTEERRQSVRAKRVMSIQHRLAKRTKSNPWHLSTTQDMSFFGLSFLSDVAYSPGDKLEVKVIMSGILDIFNGTAEVVRIEKKKAAAFSLVGIKFNQPKAKKRKAKKYSKTASTPKNRIRKAIKKK